jgi:hypothetical protein
MTMDDSDQPFKILSPTKVWLSATARQLAAMHNMSEEQMARHVLAQDRLQELGLVQKQGES